MTETTRTGHKTSLDIIRIVATLSVILLHAASLFVAGSPVASADFHIANVIDGAVRFGVPFFVMLSGALLLREDKELPVAKLTRNGIRTALLLVFWSAFYAAVFQVALPLVREGGEISFRGLLSALIGGHYHLWYLYMLLGLYLVTPILRLFVRKSNASYVLYFVLLALIFSYGVPLLNEIGNRIVGQDLALQFFDRFHLQTVGGYTAYYLVGWYTVSVGFGKTARQWLYGVGILGASVSILGVALLATEENRMYGLFYEYTGLPVFFAAVALFVFLYTRFSPLDSRKGGASRLTALSGLTFGVYVIHVLFLQVLNGVAERLLPLWPAWLAIPVLFVTVTPLSFGTVFLLSKIPVLRKLVRT